MGWPGYGSMLNRRAGIATNDYACDPTALYVSDPTREQNPVLAFGPDVNAVDLGGESSDIGETLPAILRSHRSAPDHFGEICYFRLAMTCFP